MNPLLISNSEIQTWKDCRRKWWLTYYRQLRLKSFEHTGPRMLGGRIHYALSEMYENGRNPVDVVIETYESDIADIDRTKPGALAIETDMRKEADLAKAMLEGYVEWVADNAMDSGIEIVAVERAVVVEAPGFEDVYLKGKLDARVVRKVDNARLFLDHKTVADLATPRHTLPMDEQMKFYHLLEVLDAKMNHGVDQEQQWRTDGALYNMLRKVKRTATAKPPFYERIEVRHNRTEIETMWYRVAAVLMDIIDARRRLDSGVSHHTVAFPRPSRDCTWKCDFFSICKMFDDGSNIDGLINEYYEEADPDERYGDDDKLQMKALREKKGQS